MNVATLLQLQARARPDAPALVDRRRGRERVTTYRELEDAAARAATMLARSGLRRGDTILVLQPMSAELYVAFLAIFRLGLVAMVLDPSAGRGHIERCCALARPRGLIACAKAHVLRLAVPSVRRIPHCFVTGPWLPGAARWSAAASLPPQATIEPAEHDTPALITFTSGSTGQAKGTVRTHGMLLAQHEALARNLGAAPGDISLMTMPVFVLAELASGATCLIPNVDLRYPGRAHAAPLIALLLKHGTTRIGASPALWERLIEYCGEHRISLPRVRAAFAGGGPVLPNVLAGMQAITPNGRAIAVYGSTEAEPISTVSCADMSAQDIAAVYAGKGLPAGCPVPEIALRILPDTWGRPISAYTAAAFADRCLPPLGIGEIVVSGRHVLPGYLHGMGDEETKFRVEGVVWHRTGDAGYLDGTGRLWLAGRCAARIQDTRGTLDPFTVECAVARMPGVHRCALVSHLDRRILVIEPRLHARAPESDTIVRCVPWAHVDDVRIVRTLPVDRRHNAKVDYPALRRSLGIEDFSSS